MAKPSKSTTQRNEHLADAILDIINARPRSPTRAELMAALAGWEPTGTAANDNGNPSPWYPSDLGQRLLDGLPRWAAAVHADCNKNDLVHPANVLGRAACAEIERRCLEAHDELDAVRDTIIGRLYRMAVDGDFGNANVFPQLVDLALAINLHDGGRALNERCGEQFTTRLMVLAVLGSAGIDSEKQSFRAHFHAVEGQLGTEKAA